MELIAVVMGCESSGERFAACKSMLDYGFANYAVITPVLEGNPKIPVKLGTADFVAAVPAQQKALLIEKAQKNQVNIQTELETEATAPVSQGQRLGTLTVRIGEQVISQVPLVAESSVLKLTFGQMFLRVLKYMTFCS